MTRSLSDGATYVLEQLKNYGTEVPPNSRFAQMRDAVCNADGSPRDHVSEKDSDFETVREALRDLSQLEFFFDQIRGDPNKDGYAPIVKRIISDSVLPQNDTKNTHGRDAQAEAFAFAVCKNAVMNPAFGEPDITCTMDGCRIGIAVKRIKSHRQLRRRLQEAARQIQGAGLSGVISAEITLAVNPSNLSIRTTEGEDGVKRWWTQEMRERVKQLDNALWSHVGAKGVMGVLLHEHCPVCFNGTYTCRCMTYGIETTNSKTKVSWPRFVTVHDFWSR